MELHKRELGTVGKQFPLWPDSDRWALAVWTVGELGEGLCFVGKAILVLVKCWYDSSLSCGFISGISFGVLTTYDTERELWSGFRSCVFETWQDSVQGLSMEEQDFALDTFMGATEEAAEHAEQEDMLTGLKGQQGV